jgi:hypothetical protein
MSEEKPTWVHTQFVQASTPKTEDGWPTHELTASINPLLDWVEITASHTHTGHMVRIPKSEFANWLKRCQEELVTPSYPVNPVDSIK